MLKSFVLAISNTLKLLHNFQHHKSNIVNSRISENEGKQLNKYSQKGWLGNKADVFAH